MPRELGVNTDSRMIEGNPTDRAVPPEAAVDRTKPLGDYAPRSGWKRGEPVPGGLMRQRSRATRSPRIADCRQAGRGTDDQAQQQ
jgi:hypothetical protein